MKHTKDTHEKWNNDFRDTIYGFFSKKGFDKFVVKCMTGEHPLDNMTAEFEFDTHDDDWFDIKDWDESYASIDGDEIGEYSPTREAIRTEVEGCFWDEFNGIAYEIGNEDDFKYELDECIYDDGKITLKFIDKK